MEEMQMLTFTLDNVLYGVNVHQVREVKNFEGVTPVPRKAHLHQKKLPQQLKNKQPHRKKWQR